MFVHTIVVLFAAAGAVTLGQPTSCDQLECSHSCVEKAEWNYICTCPEGLILKADKRTCGEPVSILLAMFRGIKLLKEGNSSELQPVLPFRASAFDIHFANKEIYAFTDNHIMRYSFNDAFSRASAPVSILSMDSMVTSLAVDWVGGRLYWVCDQRSTLESATTDGTARKTILTLEDNPEFKDVVVDPYKGKVFWLSSKGIYSSDLSGDTVKPPITTTALVKPEHLSLDTIKQLIYVIGNHGNGDKAVVKYQYDGSQVGTPFTLQGQKGGEVFGLGVIGDQLFWQSNQNGENLYKCVIPANAGIANVTLVEEIDQIVYGLKIVHPDIQKSEEAKKVPA